MRQEDKLEIEKEITDILESLEDEETREAQLLRTIEEHAKRGCFEEHNISINIEIELEEGYLIIFKERGNSYNNPFQIHFVSEKEDVYEVEKRGNSWRIM